jgi:hypothetical protein
MKIHTLWYGFSSNSKALREERQVGKKKAAEAASLCDSFAMRA